ncbi:MAG: hypothetical protein IKL84_08515 [Clostridia bacterium]|nr:hypothetical protein [Clostridia bacterium]
MDTKYLKTVLFYFLTAVCAVILIFYLCYHLFNGFSAEIVTEPALKMSARESLSLQGYIFRDETVIRAGGGTVDYAVDDGERIGVNALIAQVYAAADDGEISRRVKEIDREIALLQDSNIGAGVVVSGTESTDRKIDEIFSNIRADLAAGRYDYADRALDSLLIQLNRRNVITGKILNYDNRIASLYAERASLTARLHGGAQEIRASSSGYFFYGVDGCENLYDPDLLARITLDEFAALQNAEAEQTSGGIGKMVSGYTWYLAVPVGKTELDRVAEGKGYAITFPYNYDLTLTLKLERSVTEIGHDDALLIFSCDVMPENFSYLRSQSVDIVTREHVGLRVPGDAVRVIDDVVGVYIVHGGRVEFRRIEILLERDGTYLVSADLTAGEDEIPYLALYDEIVTAGKDLYEGKILG